MANPFSSPQYVFKTCLLGVIAVLAVVRLLGYTAQFRKESLQMDFAAFYTAGESLNHGLSPYDNNIHHDPPIWDGICRYEHSRFLYPPLVARLFQPLALMPYRSAKTIWMILSLAALAGSLYLTSRTFSLGGNLNAWLLVIALTALFHPLLALLERGQIDSITLLVTIGAISMLIRTGHRSQWAAGGLFALSTLLKLHCIYVVPFLLLRRKWNVMAGYVMGGLLLLILSGFMPGGAPRLFRYITEELPRVAKHGEKGTEDMKVDPALLKATQGDVPKRMAPKGGRTYQHEAFRFSREASSVELLQDVFGEEGIMENPSHISLAVFACLFALMLLWQKRYDGHPESWGNREEFLYWVVITIIILLSGPLTWVMNAVWLLPLSVVAVSEFGRIKSTAEAFFLAMVLLGLLLVALPGPINLRMFFPFFDTLVENKFVVGKVLVCVALVLYLGRLLRRRKLEAAAQ